MWFWKKENLSQPPDGLNIYLKCIENKQSLHMLQDFISKEFLRLRILKILKRTYFTFGLPKSSKEEVCVLFGVLLEAQQGCTTSSSKC